MNKKLFGTLLMGSLLMGGTFVSCQDYDDEINDLQTQIDKLASADALSSKVSELQSAISAAQSAAEAKAAAAQKVADAANAAAGDAKSAAEAAQKAADEVKAAAEKTANDLTATQEAVKVAQAAADAAKAAAEAAKKAADEKATKEDVAAAVAAAVDAQKKVDAEQNTKLTELSEAIAAVKKQLADAKTDESLKTINEKLAAIEKQVKEATNAKVLVTEVSLVEAFNSNGNIDNNQGYYLGYRGLALDLGFKAVSEQTTVFGKGLPGEITFEAGKAHSLKTSNIIVRVNPANATLAKEDVTLIDSKGNALEVLEVADVKPYEGLITRAAANTGLWVISVKMKDDVSMDALKKATTTKVNNVEKKICYAVAIGDETRSVVSTYDITAAPNVYTPAKELDFFASNKDGVYSPIAEIHNRYIQSENGNSNDCINNEEYVWYDAVPGKSVVPAIVENIVKKTDVAKKLYQNVANRDLFVTDDRQNEKLLAVEVNKPIDLHVAYTADNKNVATEIKGFYVSYDERNAVESAPSEINAWKSYEVENLNTVIAGNTGSITIKSESANGDVIGFRVYAVNLDGTLLDPDGRAFYVYVGDATKIGTVPTQPIKAIAQYGSKTTTDFLADFKTAVAGVKVSGYTATGWTNTKKPEVKDKDGNKLAIAGSLFNVVVDNVVVTNANITTIDFANAKKVEFVMPNAQDFVDGGTYEQKMDIYKTVGSTQVLVKTITVSFTKVMPSEAPVVKYITGQTGELLLSPVPNPTTLADYGYNGTIANQASINLSNVYYELAHKAAAGTIKFTVDNSAYDATPGKQAYLNTVSGYNGAATDLVVANADNAKFTALTDGSAHTIKFTGFYPGVSYHLNAAKTAMVTEGFSTAESTDYSVTYNCWHKFTTWNWNYIKYASYDATAGKFVINADPKNNTKTFAPQLQWTTAGSTIEWGGEILKASNSKNPEIFNATMADYISKKVVGTPAANDVYLQDVVNPDQINSYFTPKFVAATGTKAAVIEFTKTQNSVNPAADVKQNLMMKMTDVFGHKVTLKLGEVTILRQK